MSITLIIIAVTAIVSYLAFKDYNLQNKLLLWPARMKGNVQEYYRFITSGFVHADMPHLIFNMITLYFFGDILEQFIVMLKGKSIYMIIMYLSAIVVSSIPSYFKNTDHYGYRSLGASGGVSALVFGMVYVAPWENLYLFMIIPVPAILFAVLYIAYCIYLDKKKADNINHNAHLWGSIYGFIYMLLVIDPTRGQLFINQLLNP